MAAPVFNWIDSRPYLAGEITDPAAFNDFLDSLPIISNEPAVTTIAPTLEHSSGGAAVLMVTDLPPMVAAVKRSNISQPDTRPTEHDTALSAYRAGDLREWAVAKLEAAGRADDIKATSAKRAKVDGSQPMATMIAGDAAVSIHIPKLAKALLTEILKYAAIQFKSGFKSFMQFAKTKSMLSLVLSYGLLYSPLLVSKPVKQFLDKVGSSAAINKGQAQLAKIRIAMAASLMLLAKQIAVK